MIEYLKNYCDVGGMWFMNLWICESANMWSIIVAVIEEELRISTYQKIYH